MSYKATNWAYDLPVTGPQKAVVVALADMADEAGTCFPGHDRISSMTGWSVSTVARALKTLESSGLISREHRQGAYGYRTSDRYRLHLEVDAPKIQPVTVTDRQKSNLSESESLPVRESIPTGQSDGAIEPSEEPLEEPSDSLAHPSLTFDDFWAIWPRTEGKRDAAKAWEKATRHEDPTVIFAAALVYTRHPNRPAIQYVPYGATWLNKERWNDGPPTAPEQVRGKPTPEQRARQTLQLATDLLDDPKGITA